MKIYVTSSWRNKYLDDVVKALTEDGHEVYDFRRDNVFSWKQVDPHWEKDPTNLDNFFELLKAPVSEGAYQTDMKALMKADACVYVLPCGVSASLELGYAKGAGKITIVYAPEIKEPELMLKMADVITDDFNIIRADLKTLEFRNTIGLKQFLQLSKGDFIIEESIKSKAS